MRYPRPRPLPAPRRSDAALAGVLAAWSVAEVVSGTTHGPAVVALTAGMAMSLPQLFRRSIPVPMALIVAAAFAAEAHLGVDTRTQVSTVAQLAAAAYAVGQYARLLPGAVVLALEAAAGATVRGVPTVSGTLFALVVVGAPWVAGQTMRAHSVRARTLAANVIEQQERARRAAMEERARIARELHDVVTHAVSIMVIQAGAAGEVLHRNPDDAGEALMAIQRTGRQALDELRRLLGVLHDAPGPANLSPQPGLAQLDGLVEQIRQTGLTVSLVVDDELPEAPVSLGLAVYRIVQEALTNVVKHADATQAEVMVRRQHGELEVRIVDDGQGDRSRGVRGHGLSGMAQRAAMFGGTLVAGDAPGSGFAVQVRLPLDAPVVVP